MLHKLSDISNGEEVDVVSVDSSGLRVKLFEMGLLEGQPLRVLFRAPFGDPIAVDINGYVLSLRLNEASLVRVKPKSTL